MWKMNSLTWKVLRVIGESFLPRAIVLMCKCEDGDSVFVGGQQWVVIVLNQKYRSFLNFHKSIRAYIQNM